MDIPMEQVESPRKIKINLSTEQEKKLGKYFMNSDPFMWGVLEAKTRKED